LLRNETPTRMHEGGPAPGPRLVPNRSTFASAKRLGISKYPCVFGRAATGDRSRSGGGPGAAILATLQSLHAYALTKQTPNIFLQIAGAFRDIGSVTSVCAFHVWVEKLLQHAFKRRPILSPGTFCRRRGESHER
jgi:hypothetical protein